MNNPALIDAMRHVSALLQAGQFRTAQAELEAIVDANPKFVEGLRLLAGTKQALGDAAAAEKLLRQALNLEPSWTPTLATLGELLLTSGRTGEAESLLLRAAAGSPPFPRAALLLARYYNDMGRPAQALNVAAPLCVSGKADAELAAQHIAALAALGRQDEAIAGYRRIVAAAPDNLAAAHALAIALGMANQHAEAARIAQQTLTRGHRSAALYNTHARSLIAQGDLERAEAALRDSVQLDPHLIEAHNNLAKLVWMRTGDIAQATATLDRALQTFADDDALWAAKAAIVQGAGNSRAAYACLASQASRPQAPPMLLVRAGLAALEFDPAAALGLAERALCAVPANAAARTLLAAAQLGIGDARGALPHCEALLANSPDDQYLIALQTTALRLLGDARYARLCDYERLVLRQQLDAPPPWPDVASFIADLKVSLNRMHDPHGHPLLFQSLRHGTETTFDLARSEDPVIVALFKSFAAPIHRYLEHVGQGTDALRRRNHGGWRFNGSWSVRLRTSGYHANHVHPRGWLSSACYIELPDCMADARSEAGILTFGEPGIATTPALSAEYSVRPSVGMLVLFPSYFWHGTVPFTGDQPRLTVAFDVVPDR
ncbi:MAG TPA: tetratricopeptide repeat protein [Steroidobacteraceae bacterium]|nr:tetratricopeptide repeat protein [Steroidobacteraceae bacterium]